MTAELEAAQAQVTRFGDQHDMILAESEAIDTEGAVLDELTALRAMVVGEARHGTGSANAFRVALRRLFTSFDLIGGARPFGSGAADSESVGWGHEVLALSDGPLALLPHMRPDVIVDWWDEGAQFPALRKAALAVRGSDANTLPFPYGEKRQLVRFRASRLRLSHHITAMTIASAATGHTRPSAGTGVFVFVRLTSLGADPREANGGAGC